jgi:hypothetical protein
MNAAACTELISELEAAVARGGAQVGVHFMPKNSKKKAEPSGDKG